MLTVLNDVKVRELVVVTEPVTVSKSMEVK